MNDTIRAIEKRASIRKFTDEPLSAEQRQALMNAAMAAPSGMNRQPWHFSFVEDKAIIGEIESYLVDHVMSGDNEFFKMIVERNGRRIFFNGALVVFLSTNNGESLVDAGVAIESIVIAAESMGLGSCIVGGCRDAFELERGDYFKQLVKFPEGYEFVVGAVIGHPAVSAKPHDWDPQKITLL